MLSITSDKIYRTVDEQFLSVFICNDRFYSHEYFFWSYFSAASGQFLVVGLI